MKTTTVDRPAIEQLINILIVDDEPKNLTVLETVLNDPGYRLVRANSADQALLALVEEEFALLILDIRMPGMTGFELAQMVKERKKTARVPIIFLTAYYNEDQHVIEGYGSGAVDYLHKPVNPAVLRSKVAVFAELHRAQRESGAANAALLAEVAERRRVEEQLRDLNENLEQRVNERAEAVRRSEGLYRAIGESIDYGVWVCAPDGRNIYASDSFLKLLGITQAQCSDFGWGDALPPEESARTIAAWQECVRTGGNWDREHRFRGADGEWHSILARGVPVRAERGEIIAWAGINLDITERKRAEQGLRETHDRLQTVMSSITDGLAMLDRDWRYTSFSAQAARIIGMCPDQLLGRTVWEVFPEAEKSKFGESYRRAVATGETVEFEEFYPAPLNKWLECRCYPSAEGLSVYFHDITARKHAEAVLGQNEELFSTIIEQAPGGVYVIDDQFRVLEINALARPMFAACEPAIGRDFDEVLRIIWGAKGPELAAIFRHTLETGERYVSPRFTSERVDLGVEQSYDLEVQRLILPNGRPGVVCYFTDITARERAAGALRASEAFNRSIVESSRDCIKVLDLEGHLLSMSPRGQQLLGISDLQPLLGQSWSEMWHNHADRAAARAAVAAAVAGGSGTLVGFLRTPLGENKWFDVGVSPISDNHGKPVRLLAVSRDITDRRRAELDAHFLAEVSHTLADFSDVTELMSNVGAKLGQHLGLSLCNFVDVDDAAGETVVAHAWHRPDVPSSVGRYRLSDFFTPEFQTTLRAAQPFVVHDTLTDSRTNAANFAALKMRAFVCMPLVRDGHWRFMLNLHHSEPHRWHEEEIELIREVAARIWARLERLRMETALRESEERFRALADNIPQLAWMTDATGSIFWYNQRWFDYTGTTLREMQGWGWQAVHHPDEVGRVTEKFKRQLAAGEPWEDTFPLRSRTGEYRWFLSRAKPIREATGIIVRWFGTNTDVTEIRETEAALRATQQAAEAANASKDRFLAALSHELRTPLTPVLMTVGALEHDPDLRADVREDLAMIKRNIELETKLIDDLLDVSRITSGKVALRLEPVDLHEAVQQTCGICRSQLHEQNVRLELALGIEIFTVAADAARLQQVLWNVLKNAVKFTPAKGTVRVSTAQLDAHRCEVRVSDTGIGIPPEVLPKIFDAFEQGDPSVTRQFGGLGLGLAISKALVELHGGTIRAESAGCGRGATFVIELPLCSGAAGTAAPERGAPERGAPERGAPEALRLLVVEDHANTARALRVLLTKAGYTVRIATGVAFALEFARRETFDLLVTDLGLPDGTGFDVLAGLKGIQPLPGIVMSGYGMDEDLSRSREAGFIEHVVKPFEGPELLAAIARASRVGR